MKISQIKIYFLLTILAVELNVNYSSSQNNGIRVLDIDYINQEHGCCWCWAACITTIANYYGNDDIQLCDIVNFRRIRLSLGSNDCCGMQVPYSAYDTTTCIRGSSFGWSTDPIRTIFQGDLNINCTYIDGVLSYSTIKQEIDNNRPVKIIVGYTGQWGPSYHSIVLYGYDDDGQMIYYIDPNNGYYTESYYNMTNSYCIGPSNLMYGYDDSCSYILSSDPCPTNLNLTVDIGSDAVIRASNSIQCSAIMTNNAEIEFISGNSIILNNGFEVELGASFTTEISGNPCQ